jgi:hypothetical protein
MINFMCKLYCVDTAAQDFYLCDAVIYVLVAG